MRILYYTGGVAGSGHIVLGLTLALALRRAGVQHHFQILSVETPFSDLAVRMGVPIQTIPAEDHEQLGPEGWPQSALFQALSGFNPDLLIVDLFWFALDAFIDQIKCPKFILIHQVDPRFFRFRVPQRDLAFRPQDYQLVAAIEPGFELPFPSTRIEPMVLRNKDEILEKSEALASLNLDQGSQNCFFGFNGHAEEGIEAWKNFSYLEKEGWTVIRSDNRKGGLFPAVDWYNAFDLLVCGAGYNAFWEARYLDKEAFFVSFPRHFENQDKRIALCSDYTPRENGADQIVRIMLESLS